MNCKNCDEEVQGKFCSNCGQSTTVDRINYANFLKDVSEGVFQINKGFFYTLKALFTRPGKSIQDYLQGKRKQHFKPVAYALLLSTVYFLLSQIIGTETFIGDFLVGFANEESEAESATKQVNAITWFADNYAYTILMLLPLYSLASYITFKKSAYNYLEHFVLNTYITGQQAVIYAIVAILAIWIENEDIIAMLTLSLSLSYAFWVFWQFFSAYNRVGFVVRFVLTYILYLCMMLCILVIIFFAVQIIYG